MGVEVEAFGGITKAQHAAVTHNKRESITAVNAISTTADAYEDMTNMSITVTTKAGKGLVLFTCGQIATGATNAGAIILNIDDSDIAATLKVIGTGVSDNRAAISHLYDFSAGEHVIKVKWKRYDELGSVNAKERELIFIGFKVV